MKFLNRSITAFVIVMLMAVLVPAAVPAYAGEVVEEDMEHEEYIEPTEEEYVMTVRWRERIWQVCSL